MFCRNNNSRGSKMLQMVLNLEGQENTCKADSQNRQDGINSQTTGLQKTDTVYAYDVIGLMESTRLITQTIEEIYRGTEGENTRTIEEIVLDCSQELDVVDFPEVQIQTINGGNEPNLLIEEVSEFITLNEVSKEEAMKEMVCTSVNSFQNQEASIRNESSPAELEDEPILSSGSEYLPSAEDEGTERSDEMMVKETEQRNNNLTEVEKDSKPKRNRKGHANPLKWAVNTNKKNREKGLSNVGTKKTDQGVWSYSEQKPTRKLKPRCNCSLSKKPSKINCLAFTEEERQDIFKGFWELDWKEKKLFVHDLIVTKALNDRKHRRQENVSKRKRSLIFHLKKENGELIRVCKVMFLSTLGINEWCALNWSKRITPIQQNVSPVNKKMEDAEKNRKIAKEFLETLPKMESHYCRKDTYKLYLEPIWRSKASIFMQYTEFCKAKNVFSVKSDTFYDVMNEMSIGLFQPKKDQCDICTGFKTGNIEKEFYKNHQGRKEEARKEKSSDKENGKLVYTMDLQAVLLSPRLKASALYYKTKLIVHNMTFYSLKNKDGFCFLWDETQGGLSGNEFASVISHFITTKVPFVPHDKVILWSDGCTYQNRNVSVSNALLKVSNDNNITITQKYLERGHTQMECDSMHATIERKLLHQDIYTPGGYNDACKHARLKPKPYEVEYLDHDYFLWYDKYGPYKSIRRGNKKGDPIVTNLSASSYCSGDTIKYKLKFSDEYRVLPQRKVAISKSLSKLHPARLKIKKEKYDDLQELKKVLPKEYSLLRQFASLLSLCRFISNS